MQRAIARLWACLTRYLTLCSGIAHAFVRRRIPHLRALQWNYVIVMTTYSSYKSHARDLRSQTPSPAFPESTKAFLFLKLCFAKSSYPLLFDNQVMHIAYIHSQIFCCLFKRKFQFFWPRFECLCVERQLLWRSCCTVSGWVLFILTFLLNI